MPVKYTVEILHNFVAFSEYMICFMNTVHRILKFDTRGHLLFLIEFLIYFFLQKSRGRPLGVPKADGRPPKKGGRGQAQTEVLFRVILNKSSDELF